MKTISITKVILFAAVLVMVSGSANLFAQDIELTIKTIDADINTHKPVNLFDQDGNGTIMLKEYEAGLNDIFDELDVDGDGAVSAREIEAADKTKMALALYDSNENGQISRSEFVKSLDMRFNTRDRNADGRIDLEDSGVVDIDNNGTIELDEYQQAIDEIMDSAGEGATRGYGYGPCSSQYMICDASCVRCIAFFIPRPAGFSWGGTWPEGTHDPCAGAPPGVCDPWSENFDPLHPCCN